MTTPTSPDITTPWLLPAELDDLLDPQLRGSIPEQDRAWWIDRAQDRITDVATVPADPTGRHLDALRRATVAWIEWRADNGGDETGRGIHIGQVTIPDTPAASDRTGPLPATVLSILTAAGLMPKPARPVAW